MSSAWRTIPLNLTVLVPMAAPKLVPLIVTDVPTGPFAGDRLVMFGGVVTTPTSAKISADSEY